MILFYFNVVPCNPKIL